MFNIHNSKTFTDLYRLVVLGKNEKKKKNLTYHWDQSPVSLLFVISFY